MNTPFQSRSRSVSSENLTSLTGVAANDFTEHALQLRLSNLEVPGGNRVTQSRTFDRSQLTCSGDGQGEHGDESGTSLPNPLPRLGSTDHLGVEVNQQTLANGNSASRRDSEEDDLTSGAVTPQHIEYSAESLAKVPSYTTALLSQIRTPVNNGLPTYQTATRTASQTPCMPRIPNPVHVQVPLDNHRDILRRCS